MTRRIIIKQQIIIIREIFSKCLLVIIFNSILTTCHIKIISREIENIDKQLTNENRYLLNKFNKIKSTHKITFS